MTDNLRTTVVNDGSVQKFDDGVVDKSDDDPSFSVEIEVAF